MKVSKWRKHDFQDSLRQRLLLGNSRDHLNGRHWARTGHAPSGCRTSAFHLVATLRAVRFWMRWYGLRSFKPGQFQGGISSPRLIGWP
jgi:hypothetical protein